LGDDREPTPVPNSDPRLDPLADHLSTPPQFTDLLLRDSDALALAAGDLRWSYAELARRAGDCAGALRSAGVEPHQVVIARADAGPRMVVMQHALARLGAALLPASPTLFEPGAGASALQALIEVTGAEWTWQAHANGGAPRATRRRTALPRRGDPLAVLIRTSGSSGAPKVAMLSQRAVLASSALVTQRLGLCPGDQWLCCLPLQHIGGLAISYRCALAGAALRLQSAHATGFDADAVRVELERSEVTHLSLVPPMLARLLEARAVPPPSLRVLLIGGQALGGELARRAVEAGWPLFVTYGMSETCSQIATAPCVGGESPDALGPPLPGVVLDCPRCGGEPRPLRIRGPMVMEGYANPERRPGLGLDAGWLVTSDLACLDADGGLRILGRTDDVLIIGGVKVLRAEIESRLAGALPGIGTLAVVGVPHPVWGQTLAACYTGVVEPGALEAWCRAHLPSSERPRIFVQCRAFPLLASGKLDRAALRLQAVDAARKMTVD
jgi:O-succinylbenzoic acid--CoA ligase